MTVPVPRKEQVLPQGTKFPGVGESEQKKNYWACVILGLFLEIYRTNCFVSHSTHYGKYIVGSRGASQLGGTFQGTLQGIRLISYSLTKLPSWYNKNTCLMLIKHSLFLLFVWLLFYAVTKHLRKLLHCNNLKRYEKDHQSLSI